MTNTSRSSTYLPCLLCRRVAAQGSMWSLNGYMCTEKQCNPGESKVHWGQGIKTCFCKPSFQNPYYSAVCWQDKSPWHLCHHSESGLETCCFTGQGLLLYYKRGKQPLQVVVFSRSLLGSCVHNKSPSAMFSGNLIKNNLVRLYLLCWGWAVRTGRKSFCSRSQANVVIR